MSDVCCKISAEFASSLTSYCTLYSFFLDRSVSLNTFNPPSTNPNLATPDFPQLFPLFPPSLLYSISSSPQSSTANYKISHIPTHLPTNPPTTNPSFHLPYQSCSHSVPVPVPVSRVQRGLEASGEASGERGSKPLWLFYLEIIGGMTHCAHPIAMQSSDAGAAFSDVRSPKPCFALLCFVNFLLHPEIQKMDLLCLMSNFSLTPPPFSFLFLGVSTPPRKQKLSQ